MSESPHQSQSVTLIARDNNASSNSTFNLSNDNSEQTESPSMKTLAIQLMLALCLQIVFIILFSLLRPKNNGKYFSYIGEVKRRAKKERKKSKH
jgi:ATP-dependent Zn protease